MDKISSRMFILAQLDFGGYYGSGVGELPAIYADEWMNE
jgi:hypothetical protein